jgi:crossover junction endodeoxyribonuclease RusA
MTSFEFVIPQRPVSQQARRRERLRERKDFVAEQARAALEGPRELATQAVAVRVLCLYDEVGLDVDNILKPIQAKINMAHKRERYSYRSSGPIQRIRSSAWKG